MKISICHLSALLKTVDLPSSTIYKLVDEELSRPQVSLAGRTNEWSQQELQLVTEALFTGKTDKEVDALVNKLVSDRKNNNGEITITKNLKKTFDHLVRRPYIVQDFIPNKGTCMVGGVDGNLNVCLAVELCLHIASGLKWHNLNVIQTEPIYCTNIECATDIITLRQRWEQKHQIKNSLSFYLSTKPLNLLDKTQRIEWIAALSQYLLDTGKDQYPGLFVIDIQDSMFDEATNTPRTTELVRCAEAFCEEIGASVILVFNKGIDPSNTHYRHLFFDVNYAVHAELAPNAQKVRLAWSTRKGYDIPKPMHIQSSFSQYFKG